MGNAISRRDFGMMTGAALAGAAFLGAGKPVQAGENTGAIKKAVKWGMIKERVEIEEKFKLLIDLGFDGVEPSVRDIKDADAFAEASAKTGLPIHGVVNGSVDDIPKAVDLARVVGANSVLVVAGRVDENNAYDKNYNDTQARIREALPYAEEHKTMLLLENVWNNFLWSPLEMARYIDEIDSPWFRAYFDVGNCVRVGWPEHWIRILGDRIEKLDIKEYSRTKQEREGLWPGFNVKIGEGSIKWEAVRAALKDIGYKGWATAEVGGGDREELADIARRMDDVLSL